MGTFMRREIDLAPAPPLMELVAAGERELPPEALVFPPPGDPMPVARQLLTQVFSTSTGETTLVYWRGDWWMYSTGQWAKVEELDVKGALYDALEHATFFNGTKDEGGEKKDIYKPWRPTPGKVHGVLEPLQTQVNKHVHNDVDAPTWIGAGRITPARECLPMGNGLLHLPTRALEPHTPALFSTYCLPFDYDPAATCPTWGGFLSEIFAHDPKGQLLVQEYAGYIVSGRLDMHKGLLIVGPSRAGKGVISGALHQLVGVSNAQSPSLRDFATDFGLAGLVGKPLATVEDARGDDDRRNNALVERLLNITAGDAVQINRKNREHWTGVLPTRLVLFSNEMPRFMDASGAVVNRFMAVHLEKSFLGKEDKTLPARISAEMPGILNWALEGLARLEAQGHFTVPGTMAGMLEQMQDLASPVAAFIADTYTVTGEPTDMVELSTVHNAYKDWCRDTGNNPPAQAEFARRLTAAVAGVAVKNMDVPGADWSGTGKRKRKRYVLGLE